jgi:hypothetical protein
LSSQQLTTLRQLAEHGATAIRDLDDDRLATVWNQALAELLDPSSPLRREIDPDLLVACRLSTSGLQAALEVVGRPLLGDAALAVLEAARARAPTAAKQPALVVLPANWPGLALQCLLPAIARRRPVLFKCPSAEPWLTPAFLAELARSEPALGPAYAAAVWRGGSSSLEAAALDACDPVVAYGDEPALESLAGRVRGRLIRFGPAFSFALLHRAATAEELAALARDVALGDQRGCLSVHVVLTTGDSEATARGLAGALAELARNALPPGPRDPAVAAAVRLVLDDAGARGLLAVGSPAEGLVLVEEGALEPSPGQRLVRVVPVPALSHAIETLRPWRGRLQGAALLTGHPAWLDRVLSSLGVSRIAPPGELQYADAFWRNGGIDLLEVF